jgi:cytochrome c6
MLSPANRKEDFKELVTTSLRRIRTLAGLLVIMAGLSWASESQSTPEAVYKSKCSTCHGADGSGNTPAGRATAAKDFREPEVVQEADADLEGVIQTGRQKMPAYQGKLSEDQVDGLVRYIRQLQSK